MKASIEWLKQYVDIKMPPEELAKRLIMSGVHVAFIHKDGKNTVLEFEITSNRSDCLSVIGLAREIAAITGSKLRIPAVLDPEQAKQKKTKNNGTIRINIIDKDLCPRYTGRVLRNVKINSSPAWLSDRLTAIGQKPVNNIVDIINYVLFETGQPMHAFDLDKISGAVIVRRAKKGETIKTIDGDTRTLEQGMLIIADEVKPIAVAGVMGGKDTEVTEGTKNILLESAFFDPISVRRTSRVLGLKSESSYRFERKVDNLIIVPSSERAAELIKESAGGENAGFCDINYIKQKEIVLNKFDPARTSELLGLELSLSRQKTILTQLDFKVSKGEKYWTVTVPARRKDISQERDLVEEIARVEGYDNIPETIPAIIGNTSLKTGQRRVIDKVRQIMSSAGLNEIVTYNLTKPEDISVFSEDPEKSPKLVNPLSRDMGVMTQTLLSGMLRAVSWNINRKNSDLSLFEIGNTYERLGKQNYAERITISVGLSGNIMNNWISGSRKTAFYDLKGILECFFQALGLEGIKFTATEKIPYMSAAAEISVKNKVIGYAGKITGKVLDTFDVNQDVFCAELVLAEFADSARLYKPFKPLPKYPSVVRDISIVSDEHIPAESIRNAILSEDIAIVKNIILISSYKGEHIQAGKIGLLYRIEYRDDEKTLTDAEIESAHTRIRSSLSGKLGITFR